MKTKKQGIIFGAAAIVVLMVSMPFISALQTTTSTTSTVTSNMQIQSSVTIPSATDSPVNVIRTINIIKSIDPSMTELCDQTISIINTVSNGDSIGCDLLVLYMGKWMLRAAAFYALGLNSLGDACANIANYLANIYMKYCVQTADGKCPCNQY